jgi:acyl-CoA synthetase (AMP-forming)/AMP-acid ligase II
VHVERLVLCWHYGSFDPAALLLEGPVTVNDRAAMVGSARTWGELFAVGVADGLPAMVFDDATLSSGDLLGLATDAARWLERVGTPEGGPVPALLTTTPAAMALAVAGGLSGRPLAPLNPRLTVRELQACIEPIDAPVIVAEESAVDVASEVAANLGRAVATLPAFDPVAKRPLSLDRPEDSIAIVLHTSGTTGIPKAVPISQRKLALRVVRQGTVMGLEPGTSFASASPFQHVAGVGTLFIALGLGALAIPSPPFTVDSWKALARHGPTHAVLVPAMIERLLDENALALPSLRVLVYGSSPMRPATVRRALDALPGVDIFNMYGQTEGSPLTFLSAADHRRALMGREELLLSVGRPFEGVELRIERADETGVGELCARGEHMFRTDPDGWLRTGDMAVMDSEGYVTLVGRKGDLIIRGGENVYPLEVERVLADQPRVREAAVIGLPDARLGERIHAVVVAADPQNPPEPEDLRAFAREQLAGFKVPATWTFVAELPRSTTGKVLRNQLLGPA